MNHEQRIKDLEKRIAELEKLITPKNKWTPLKEGAELLGISKTVIYTRIKDGILKHNIDYRLNGNRYLINLKSVEKKIC